MTNIGTPLTRLLGIEHPIMLAGMNAVAHADLVSAVSNAGGIGVIGGLSMTPKVLRQEIKDIKSQLASPNLPFGVDLALPQVGGNARKTNHDYTHGTLPELCDIIIEEKASIFVSAVGVPPQWMIDKLHGAGIPVMNMVGAPHHAIKALDRGVDIICAQGTEGGGHTGDIATSVLIPAVVDAVKGRKSPITGEQVLVVAGGGIFDGRGLAAALALGAAGVWVGTRFIACVESQAPTRHKEGVLKAKASDTTRTLIYSGRPLRVYNSPYVKNWNENRADEIRKLTSAGTLPFSNEMKEYDEADKDFDMVANLPLLMGQAAGNVHDVPTAKEIVDSMMSGAIEIINGSQALVTTSKKSVAAKL